MTTNEHNPQPQPAGSSSAGQASAFISVVSGVISLIGSMTFLPHDPWFGWIYGVPLLGAAILPGFIAALIPRASRTTRIVALVGLVLGVLALVLWNIFATAYCNGGNGTNCA